MFCSNCGQKVEDGVRFCPGCGSQISGNNINQNAVQQTSPTQIANTTSSQPNSPNKPANSGSSGIIIACVIGGVLIIGAIITFFLSTFLSKYDVNVSLPWVNSDKQVYFDEAEVEEIEVFAEEPDLIESVNTLISSYGLNQDVAVAVVDNKSNEEYFCNGSSVSYTSWGFYLPAYMAFSDLYPSTYASYKNDIMSADPGRCNSAANFAIDACGGTTGISNYISSTLGYPKTSFGRKFGQTNTQRDNYTTASEAAQMLNEFNRLYHYSYLCYNPSSFGISVPSGATMYAQLGSENINVKKNLNVFAIMKGNHSNYSIAILTKNKASSTGIVNEILRTVHSNMEGKY